LESDVVLLRAASGLERLMSPGLNKGVLRDSTVAQISAALYYQTNVLAGLTKNAGFQKLFRETLYKQILEDFGNYVDAKARSNPKSLHHVYEWNRVGNPASRLFKLNSKKTGALSFSISYSFLMSKTFVPHFEKRRHVFKNKAAIIESGKPLVISPRNSKRLVFEINGEKVFMPVGKSVTVNRPGGKAATNQFSLAYSRFFSGNLVKESIKRSGFNNIFNSKTAKALRIPGSIKTVRYSFSPNTVRKEAESSLLLQFGGVVL
jgi:hypothetical protein